MSRGDRSEPYPAGARVTTRFFPLSDRLAPYVSAIYLTDVTLTGTARIEDYLHPEWANMRFIEGEAPRVAIGDDPRANAPRFVVTGPTSRASYFAAGTMRVWGIGILPVGWAKLMPIAADALADKYCDGHVHPAFAAFTPLANVLSQLPDVEAAAAAINAHFRALLNSAPPDDPAVLAAHRALVDDEAASVADLSARLGLSERSVERLSRRAFGFTPKLLLRRQRFLRSLGRFMLNPASAWIDSIDHHYYDQAQFTRDFQRFMGMSPRNYAAHPKPIMGAAAFARAAAAGAPVQGLHRPLE